MKKPKGWSCKEQRHEGPAAHSMPEAKSLAELRMLNCHSSALKNEIGCGEAVTCASGQCDHQIVYQSGRNEHQETGRRRTESPVQRAKDQLVGKLTETKVPALSPELAKGRGAEGCRHDGFCIDAKALPQETYDLEGAEVKQQD